VTVAEEAAATAFFCETDVEVLRHMDKQRHRLLLITGNASCARRVPKLLAEGQPAAAAYAVGRVEHLCQVLDHLSDHPADVVVADLPIDGVYATEGLRLLAKMLPDLPIVALAHQDDPRLGEEALRSGAQDVLVKWRFDGAALARSLRHAIERKGRLNVVSRRCYEHESNLLKLLTQDADGVLVLDTEGVIRFANPAAEGLFGRPIDELIGQPFGHPAVAGDSSEVRIFSDGREGPMVEMRTLEANWQGRRSRFVLLRDITDLRRSQEHLRHAIKMETVGQLTAGLAHDFNNKLTIISGFTTLAMSQVEPSHPAKDSLDQIARASDQAANLVRQLLSFGRKQLVHPEVVSLSRQLEPMKVTLEKLLGERVRLVFDLAAESGNVRVDPAQFDEAVINMAVNARDAMPAGGELHIRTACVNLSAAEAHRNLDAAPGPHVMLTVTDTGVGMDEQTVSRIFEPFFTTKDDGEGTGLGLAMVYGFVVQSGGHITVTSQEGSGTTFRIYFPRAEAPARPAEEPTAPGMFAGRGTETVLLAEDEEAVRNLLTRVLRQRGYDVIEAVDGEDALAKSHSHGGPVDLLVTDVVMPGMNGWALARAVRAQRPETKVIYVTGYTQDIVEGDKVAAEGAALLHKPFSPDELLEAVRRAVQKNFSAQSLLHTQKEGRP